MHRSLLRLLASLALVASTLMVAPATALAESGGSCFNSTGGNYHIIVHKTIGDPGMTAAYFDHVEGKTKVVVLEQCGEVGSWYGGTFVLPANVETADGDIHQLGYGYFGGEPNPRFVTARYSSAMIEITSVTPVVGETYRFTVKKSADNDIRYTIERLDGDELHSYYTQIWSYENSTSYWPLDATVTWWGSETWRTADGHGGTSNGQSKIWDMRYSVNNSTGLVYRSNLYCSSTSYPQDDIYKNFSWDGSSSPCSPSATQRGQILTTTYTGDTLTTWHSD